MKYFLVFSLFSCFLLSTYYDYIYKPMKDRDRNFGNDVCFYKNTSTYSYDAYVKPCEEGKKCTLVSTGSSAYIIKTCQDSYEEEYDNEGETCQTKDDILQGIDCTSGYTCNSGPKCSDTDKCPKNQFRDKDDNCQSNDPGYCEEYEFDSSGVRKIKSFYTRYDAKGCIKIDLKQTNNANYKYQIEKVWTNYYASLDDGTFVQDSPESLFYCKSGYALYFYGNGELKNPNADNPSDEPMYLRCVTILGRDAHGILKYKIGDGEEKYYKPSRYSHTAYQSLNTNDPHLMLKLKFFKNFRERLNGLSCKETNDCEDNELSKWQFFYDYPEYYFLYKDEPQVLEYLIQTYGGPYKPKHTSSDASSFLNIEYLTLLALLLLF
jgi:hypothetical protein